jgi:AcrR family transcriptional regulator
MQDLQTLLAQFEPEGLGPEGPRWQQRKSAQTRISILDAAIDCLATHGYARTTTQLIAETAGISRGAMLHHYPTKSDLIGAIIAYAVYKRMEMLIEGVKNISERQRVHEFSGLDILWEAYNAPEYRAYLELYIASRTDLEVREVFIPQARRFTTLWRAEGIRIFPEWAVDPVRLGRASDFTEAVLQGVALNAEVWNDPERQARMRGFVRRVVALIYAGELHFHEATAASLAADAV